jgi:hypothetical protein
MAVEAMSHHGGHMFRDIIIVLLLMVIASLLFFKLAWWPSHMRGYFPHFSKVFEIQK